MQKVVLGLSGGVDSAVAARLLKAEYEVYGLFLDIGLEGGRSDALAAADSAGIPLKVVDIRRGLEEHVCAPFVSDYLHGRTPNPCVMCNRLVKFAALLDYADEAGAPYISTGHYARAENGAVYKGTPSNDQSYMLCRLTPEQAKRLILPLGGYDKRQVRRMAERLGLSCAGKPDSMEICFIPGGDYAAYIEGRGITPPEGDFVGEDGSVLGRHRGIHHYTVGQRRGLGLSMGRRVFVADIRPEKNEVVISDGGAIYRGELYVSEMSWLIDAPVRPFRAQVKVRHSKAEYPAVITPGDGAAGVRFDEQVRAPVSGQAAAVYDGERLLGGGTISDYPGP